MSYTEELARITLYAYYGLCVFVIYTYIQDNWWRVTKRIDRIKHPEKYDKNLRDFKYWMRQTVGNHGFYISSNTVDNIIIGNACYSNSILTRPPKYEAVS